MLRSLILTGAVNGLFFILLLKNKWKRHDNDKVLMLWMGIISVQLLFYYDNLSAAPVFPVCLQLLCLPLPFIGSAVLYFYTCSLSFGYTFKWRNILIHLIPYLVFITLTFYAYNNGNLYLKDGLPHFSNTLQLWILYLLTTLLAVVPGGYAIAGLIVLIKHQKMLPNNYSYTEKINLNWLKWIVISLLVLFVGLFLFIKYGVKYGLVTYPHLFEVVGAVLSGYVFFIGFCGLHQNAIVTFPAEDDKDEDAELLNYKKSGMTDDKVEQLFALLKHHMDDKKPFLEDDLSLAMLAAQIQITSNQLSQVINQKAGCNFFNFINAYRVQAVKDKFNDLSLSHYSILGIAYDSGFRSKSSFNKIFKEITGQTPQQYRKNTN
jgi:AraC-like DNA-binding protein